MKIAFDPQIFIQRHGGASRYFAQLVLNLSKLGCEPKIYAGLFKNEYLKKLPPSLYVGIPAASWPQKLNRPLDQLNHCFFSASAFCWNPRIVHETYFGRRRLFPRPAVTITTVYDMIHELYPGNFPVNDSTSERKKQAVKRADHVICISDSTKHDLIRLWGVPEDKISVTHLACDPPLGGGKNGMELPALPNAAPFILYVGQRGGYKNFILLLRAFSVSPDLKRDFGIIAFGGGGFTSVELAAMKGLGLDPERVRQVGGDDAALASCYRSAAAFVYPSLYEGFGIPPLEAMSYDCPVISSNQSSMPEVIGDAAGFFDPASVEQASDAIRRVLYDSSRRRGLIEAGRRRVAGFSWLKCAEQTLAIYQNAARNRF